VDEIGGGYSFMVFKILFLVLFLTSFAKGLISGLEPFLHMLLQNGFSPEEIAIRHVQLQLALSISSWLLLIALLLLVYFLCKPLSLKDEYKGLLKALSLGSVIGIFLGSFLGFLLSDILNGEVPCLSCIAIHSLLMIPQAILYIFAGFFAVVLSCLRRS